MSKDILVVDDDERILRMISRNLKRAGYNVFTAENGEIGVKQAQAVHPDLILMDIMMPVMDGLEALHAIRADESIRNIPVLMLTANSDKKSVEDAVKNGANDFVVKPFDVGILLDRVCRWSNSRVEEEWEELEPNQKIALHLTLDTMNKSFECVQIGKPLPYEEIQETCHAILKVVENDEVQSILQAVQSHDNATFVHGLRVAAHLAMFSRFKNLGAKDSQALTEVGILHDIGKAKIARSILGNPGALNGDELLKMREHVEHTIATLKETPNIPEMVIEIAACCHERLDGNGYPSGLKDDQIGLLGRMMAIVDSFDTIVTNQVYRPAFTVQEAFETLRASSGHLDQDLLLEFKEMILA